MLGNLTQQDWLGIVGQLSPALASRPEGDKTVLLIGAGGTSRAACYAFRDMAVTRVYIYNRTTERAATLAGEMNEGQSRTKFEVLPSLEDVSSLDRLDAVMGTVPGKAALCIPLSTMERHRPIVMDAAYQSSATGSRLTSLLQNGKRYRCHTIEGMEMLFEQGCAQCERWTGLPAPRKEIATALLKERFDGDPEPPANLVKEAAGSPHLYVV